MITLTTIASKTVDAIKAGHDTNAKMAKLFNVAPETVGSRCGRLRKLGIVIAGKKQEGIHAPWTYEVLDVEYVISDKPVYRPPADPAKKYADMGEEVFDNLNFYLYPNRGKQA